MRTKASRKLRLIICLVSLSAGPLFAIAPDAKPVVSTPESCTTSVNPVPVLFYTPETEFGVGVGFPTSIYEDGDCHTTRPDIVFPAVLFTQRNQMALRLLAKSFFNRGDYYIDFVGAANRFPDKYYGIGDSTDLANEELFTEKYTAVTADLYRRVSGSFYLGPSFVRDVFQVSDIEGDGPLSRREVPGSEGGAAAGAGLKLLYHTTDNVFQPHHGILAELGYTSFHRGTGSDFTYRQTRARFRMYHPLFPSNTLAYEAMIDDNNGDVPFRRMALLGGQNLLRGYFQGRFRDKSLAATQIEDRHHFSERWSANVFTGVGCVAPQFSELFSHRAIMSGGAGLRYVLDLESRLNLRLDYAVGSDSRGIYFGAGEAF